MRKEITVTKEYSGTRIDRFVGKYYPTIPRGMIQKMLRKGDIRLNGKKTAGETRVEENDVVRVFTYDEVKKTEVRTDVGDIDVIYEDESLICMSKPAGLVTHPDGKHDDSLSERLIKYLYSEGYDGVYTASPLNRLDYNTSGIVLAAKTPDYARVLARSIAKENVVKEYIAIVSGEFTEKRKVTSYAVKDESKNKMFLSDEPSEGSVKMISVFEGIEVKNGCSLVKCRLITGKTHQIRSQLEYIGYPIVGDTKYSTEDSKIISKKLFVKRQMLHCFRVTVPTDFDTVKVFCPPAKDMMNLMKKLGFNTDTKNIQEI